MFDSPTLSSPTEPTVSERKRTEETLSSQAELLDLTHDSIMMHDLDDRIIFWNRGAEQIFGWSREEAVGRVHSTLLKAVFPVERRLIHEQLMATGRWEGELFQTRRDGRSLTVASRWAVQRDSTGAPMAILVTSNDITQRKHLEEELFKAQKLESIGLLAGGIAHDFNNLLTAILGNITLARRASPREGESALLLAEAEKGCMNAKSLTNQLLTFAKGGTPIRTAARIGALVRETAGFILRGSPVTCTFDIPHDLPPVEIDGGQISQVLQNIIMNAVQAMPTPGTVIISAEHLTPANEDPTLVAGREYVRISIRDQGIGIPEEELSRIFDPFFTTKENGTGLGLASAYSIMTQHEGRIRVESRPGEGTTFHLFLPASHCAPVPDICKKSLWNAPPESARILVMDDDRKIRMVLERFLKSIGYDTVSVCDGRDAVTRYQEERTAGAPFHAVIMDLTVPGGMGGREAMEQLLKIDPTVTAIVSSGYSDDPVMADYRKFGFQAVLAKPYQLHDLEQMVRRIMAT